MTSAVALPKGRLLQVLGLWFGIAAIIGNSIGIGIMRTPSEVARHLPTTTGYLLAWIAGGLYAALGVASLAELGVRMPRSGGQYVFARTVFGPYAGFVVGWSDWFSSCASAAAVSMAVAEYAGAFGSTDATAAMVPIALGIVLLFTAILWRGVRSSDITVQVMTLAKVVVLVGVPLLAFAIGARAPREAATAGVGALTVGGVILAMQSVIYSYDGWTGVLYFSGEVKDPGRDIPRSMFGGVASVFAIYMLLVACFVYVLGISGVAANNFPAGQVATAVFGATGGTIIRIVVIITGLGAVPPIVMMASRVLYAMSVDGLFARRAAAVNEGGTPTITLALSALLTIGFIVSGTFSQVIAIAAFFFVLQYVMSFSALFVLRRREPDRPSPYRAIGYPVTTAISWLGGVAFLIGAVVQDRRNSAIALGILAVSYPVYRILRLPRNVSV
ncbi:MAG TPA: APC family permease [Gemmatimonadaceae bacterium]|nr:APC family permease [Gemmatimonadaceae bacterium]